VKQTNDIRKPAPVSSRVMLYPTWQRLPRPPSFPHDPRLDRLLASTYDPGMEGFKLSLVRCEARDLRKGLFGPKGSRVVPKFCGDPDEYDGVMEFVLPNGWRLRLIYEPRRSRRIAGSVEAEFIPPRVRRRLRRPKEGIPFAA
jgi:hypothetical protein